MNSQMVTIELEASAAEILRALQEKAEARGVTLEALLRTLIEENGTQKEMTPEARADEFVRWLKAHSVKGIIADDSRESIYTREDDAIASNPSIVSYLQKYSCICPGPKQQ
ncbi:MAG: hypothetical protein J2P41_09685 [Blastocatellia bacterium]|nr:hypothetical protein [Blastocatellia bacterium]